MDKDAWQVPLALFLIFLFIILIEVLEPVS